jgi:hypothetical protein
MKRTILVSMLVLLLNGCNDFGSEPPDYLTELPQVVVTETNYMPHNINGYFPHASLLHKFSDAYNGRYSANLKAKLLSNMEQQVEKLGRSKQELRECMLATGQFSQEALALPYRAEKAKYDSWSCWILEFICSHGTPIDLGHYRCFVMDTETHDTLLYFTCR